MVMKIAIKQLKRTPPLSRKGRKIPCYILNPDSSYHYQDISIFNKGLYKIYLTIK